ncbi:lipopolysaccharide biosynthesis protein [Pseudomonas sp. PGPR40]|uniref:lipopolysaccharide biosynthesis protein n=1 Tax=Pseudomonas sp. PGPR40 TaxID=2913476 RepID=UPI001EDA36B8|nr:oligosaccharide flippase family protein [Pseudomonas sp. PGPR40]
MKNPIKSMLRKIASKLHLREGENQNILKNIIILASGSSAAKVISLVSIPIITRLYTPEQFGVYTLFASIIFILSPFGSFRYAAAIPLPKRSEIALCLLIISISSLLLISFAASLILFFYSDYIFGFLSVSQLTPFWFLLIFGFLGAGVYEALCNWAIRSKNFKSIAKTNVNQALSGAISKILLALLGVGKIGLLIGHILNQVGGSYSLAKSTYADIRVISGKRITRQNVLFTMRYFSEFPAFRLPSQILLTLSMQAPALFMSSMYGAEVAGQLGLALMALALPVALIAQTTGQAYYAEISKIGRKNNLEILKLTKFLAKKLILLGILPTIIIAVLGPLIFSLFFGAQWKEAGVYCSLLSIYLLSQFVANPISNALNVFKQQKKLLIINFVRLLLTGSVFAVSAYFRFTPKEAIALYSVVLSLHYIGASITVINTIRRQLS